MRRTDNYIIPAFFVIGVQKGGTSTIHDWFHQNPHIDLPVLKETHFFSDDERFRNGLAWYSKWFSGSDSEVRMEVDPSYLYVPETSERMKQLSKKPTGFIIIFRDPLTRAFSQYRMSVQRGLESRNFVDALNFDLNRLTATSRRDPFPMDQNYLSRGEYSRQVQRFQTNFPDSKFLFLKFDDLLDSACRRKMYTGICSFLSIPSEIDKVDLNIKSRPASTSKLIWLTKLLHRKNRVKDVIRKIVPSDLFRARMMARLDTLNKKEIATSETFSKSDLPKVYLQWSNVEIEKIANLTGLELNEWFNN